MVVHPANTPWQVLPAVANGMGSREQDFPAPTTRVGSPTFITKTGQEPNLSSFAVSVGSRPYIFAAIVGSYALLVRGSGVEESDGRLYGYELSTPSTPTIYHASAPPNPRGAPHRSDRGAGGRVLPAGKHGPGGVLPALCCPARGVSPRPTGGGRSQARGAGRSWAHSRPGPRSPATDRHGLGLTVPGVHQLTVKGVRLTRQ